MLQMHKAEILVADYEAKSIEGNATSLIGAVRFKSEAAVMDFYNAWDHQPLKKIRLESTTNGWMILAKELAESFKERQT